jgi:hypothetical protein
MEKEQQKPTAEAPSPTDEQPNQEKTVKDPEAVLAKNRELLSKLKETGDKMKEMEKQLYSLKSDKLTAEGKKDELIETLKEQLDGEKKRNQEVTWKAVSRQIGMEAAKRGCKNVDTLMKVVDFKGASIDMENFTVANDDINLILDKAMKDHDYLFDKGMKGPKDAGPGKSVETKTNLKDLKTSDLIDLYKKISLR